MARLESDVPEGTGLLYDPMTDPVQVKIDVDKVVRWLKQGAQPSEAARSLLKREGILERLAETRKSTASA